ncbi:MAG TPA: MerR family transcriptional regulator [Rhodobacteraceae bacterium]|nr:MerR family transcriptional regulator [Paracoccaceae bacterium]
MYIKEFSARSGFSSDTLRYYEKIGLIAPPMRDGGGRRVYSKADLTWTEFLGRLKATGMGISEMGRYARLRAEGDQTATERQQLLKAHRKKVRAQIAILNENLAALDKKIDTYSAMIEAGKGERNGS